MREIQESEYRMLDRITDKYSGLTFGNAIMWTSRVDWGFALIMPIFQRESVMRYRYYVREIVTRDSYEKS